MGKVIKEKVKFIRLEMKIIRELKDSRISAGTNLFPLIYNIGGTFVNMLVSGSATLVARPK